MNEKNRPFVIFILTMSSTIYWVVGQIVNVHESNLLVIYELLWLPMIILLFTMPVFSLWYWIKTAFKMDSLYLYSLLLGIGTMVFLFTRG